MSVAHQQTQLKMPAAVQRMATRAGGTTGGGRIGALSEMSSRVVGSERMRAVPGSSVIKLSSKS